MIHVRLRHFLPSLVPIRVTEEIRRKARKGESRVILISQLSYGSPSFDPWELRLIGVSPVRPSVILALCTFLRGREGPNSQKEDGLATRDVRVCSCPHQLPSIGSDYIYYFSISSSLSLLFQIWELNFDLSSGLTNWIFRCFLVFMGFFEILMIHSIGSNVQEESRVWGRWLESILLALNATRGRTS